VLPHGQDEFQPVSSTQAKVRVGSDEAAITAMDMKVLDLRNDK